MEQCVTFIRASINNIYDIKSGDHKYNDGIIDIKIDKKNDTCCVKCSYLTQYFNYKNCNNLNDVDHHINEYIEEVTNDHESIAIILEKNQCENIAQLIDRIKGGTETQIWLRTFVVDTTGKLMCKISTICGTNINLCRKDDYLRRNGILDDLKLIYGL